MCSKASLRSQQVPVYECIMYILCISYTVGGGTDWNKCKAVANIIASCPSQASSMEDYYSLVCPQVCVCVIIVG